MVMEPGRHAREMLEQSDGSSRRKVATLADWFGVKRLTPASRARMESALLAEGVLVEPSLASAPRNSTVRLYLQEPNRERPETGASGSSPTFGHTSRPWWRRKRIAALAALFLFAIGGALSAGLSEDPAPVALSGRVSHLMAGVS
jgi:hypothetical protein